MDQQEYDRVLRSEAESRYAPPRGSVSASFARQLQKNAGERGDAKQVAAIQQYLRDAKPSWQKDNLGVRGNPIQFHREQMRNDVPLSTVSRRALTTAEIQQLAADVTDSAINNTPPGGTGNPQPNPTPFGPQNPNPDPTVRDVPAGVDLVLCVFHGRDVGYPDNWGVFTWDEAYIYSNPQDTGPTFIRADSLTAGQITVVKTVNIWRNDVYYGRGISGTEIMTHAHRDSVNGGTAGPAYRIYATNARPYN